MQAVPQLRVEVLNLPRKYQTILEEVCVTCTKHLCAKVCLNILHRTSLLFGNIVWKVPKKYIALVKPGRIVLKSIEFITPRIMKATY